MSTHTNNTYTYWHDTGMIPTGNSGRIPTGNLKSVGIVITTHTISKYQQVSVGICHYYAFCSENRKHRTTYTGYLAVSYNNLTAFPV